MFTMIERYKDHPQLFSILDWLSLVLTIVSLLSFSLSTIPHLALQYETYFWVSEFIIVSVFSTEYVARIIFTQQRKAYIFSFYGVIDFLAIVPFLLAFAVDLRSIRILRILVLIRLLKITRYNRALLQMGRAFKMVKEEILIFLVITLTLLCLCAVAIYHFEHAAQPENFRSFFDSLWWAVVTLTTVGYGDITPITTGGRLFTMFILLIGLGIVAIPTGLLSSALTSVRSQTQQQDD